MKQRFKPSKIPKKPTRRDFFSAFASPFKRAAHAAGNVAAQEMHYKGMAKVSRREAIKRIGIGTGIAVAGLWKLRPWVEMPYWLGLKPRHQLELAFIRHFDAGNAKPIVDRIAHAKASGKPFHFYFFEDPLGERKNIVQEIRFIHEGDELIRNHFRQFNEAIRSGRMPRKEAIERTKKWFLENFFQKKKASAEESEAEERGRQLETELRVNVAIENIHQIPIESHDEAALRRIQGQIQRLEAENAERRQLVTRGASLVEFQDFYLRHANENIEEGRLRDSEIATGLEKRFELAKQIFAEELGNTPEVRGIGWLGAAHSQVMELVDRSNSRAQVTELPFENYEIEIHLRKIVGHRRPINAQEARMLALGKEYFDRNVPSIVQSGRQELAKIAFKKILTIGQEEFEELSRKTEGIKDDTERNIYLSNYLTGGNYFTK